jgi:hypothetical protein
LRPASVIIDRAPGVPSASTISGIAGSPLRMNAPPAVLLPAPLLPISALGYSNLLEATNLPPEPASPADSLLSPAAHSEGSAAETAEYRSVSYAVFEQADAADGMAADDFDAAQMTFLADES